MSALFVGVIAISLTYLVLIPVIRLWLVTPDEIRGEESAPKLAPQ